MKVQYCSETDPKFLEQQLLAFTQDESVKGIMLLTCDDNNYNKEEIDPVVRKISKPLFGGVFPGLIYNNMRCDSGFIIAGLDTEPDIHTILNISQTNTNLDEEMIALEDRYSETKTMFIFLDGLASRINAFVESLFTVFGLEANYIGGGAGSLSLNQAPCIITNQGVFQDAAIIVGLSLDSGIGVSHGWETVSGPYRVTSAEKTAIKELDLKPAFEVYREVVENHSDAALTTTNFFDVAKAYPFGINKVDAEKVIRDPLFIGEGNSMICVGEVETGSFVDILTGDSNSLIGAARQAAETAIDNKAEAPQSFSFIADCISRVLFLKDDYKKELDVILSSMPAIPIFGVLSIGEIANNGKDYLEFYNKTCVIGCF